MFFHCFSILFALFAAIYGGEGLNILLRILPSRYCPHLLRKYGAQVGDRVRIRVPLIIHNSALDRRKPYQNLCIGNDVFIGRECMIDLQSRVSIESNVTLSHRVMIVTHTDAGESPLRDTIVPTSSDPVTIQYGAYLGVNVTVLEGVTIGRDAVVGACALVRRDVADHTIVAGVPAKLLRDRS